MKAYQFAARIAVYSSTLAVFCLLVLILCGDWKSSGGQAIREYSYHGFDHPDHFIVSDGLPTVELTVEESVHYGLSGDQADADWLSNSPLGVGHVHLGEISRLMGPSMFHEMHCIRSIRYAIASGTRKGPISSFGHIGHCFNYLRQAILCDADLTLEPGDAFQRDFTVDRVGMTHTCHDWRAMYGAVEKSYHMWEDHLREVLNITSPNGKGISNAA
ncbi:hypothetical protein C8Q75DRAFT_801618 [Abortiporus biennis]|nr:hypothetical protein C8Q75DRAFT_801618 [Abortiporus biennis]